MSGFYFVKALSSVVERYLDTVEVSSSTLLVPTKNKLKLVLQNLFQIQIYTFFFDKMLSKNFAINETTTTRF